VFFFCSADFLYRSSSALVHDVATLVVVCSVFLALSLLDDLDLALPLVVALAKYSLAPRPDLRMRRCSSSRICDVTFSMVNPEDGSVHKIISLKSDKEGGSECKMANGTNLSLSSTPNFMGVYASRTRESIWGSRGPVSEKVFWNTATKRRKASWLLALQNSVEIRPTICRPSILWHV